MVDLPGLHLPVETTVEKITYKAWFDTDRGEFSGMMIIKKMSLTSYRVAFFNEVGMSYLDGEIDILEYPYKINVNSINPLFSSTQTVETLDNCLNLLLIRKRDLKAVYMYRDKEIRFWMDGKTKAGNSYWGRMDSDGKIDKAYFDTQSDLKADFEYDTDIKSFPSAMVVKYKGKKDVFSLKVM
jgi:hypothetical protein